MSELSTAVAFAAQALRISTPYALAALGGVWCERAGVINVGLEGMLLAGAFGAALGGIAAPAGLGVGAGVACGVALGVALAAVHGAATIRLRANQVVSGVAVTLLAGGATRYFLKLWCDSSSNSPRLPGLDPPAWARDPQAGAGLPYLAGETLAHPLFVVAVLLLVGSHLALSRTRLGLRLTAVGEHPEAAESVGVPAARMRWFGVLASGALAGLGGAWLAFEQHGFVAGMSAGRGYIALAAMILGGWRPLPTALACLLFGTAEAAQLRLQSLPAVSATGLAGLIQALPYVLTVAALALRVRGRVAPRALGRVP